jgi:hypothetical protein
MAILIFKDLPNARLGIMVWHFIFGIKVAVYYHYEANDFSCTYIHRIERF